MSFGSVSGKPWGEVFLIGGGPSLRGFDFERLRGRVLVAVNDAAVHVPFASALFSMDATWIRNRWREITNFTGEKYLAVAEDFDFTNAVDACYLKRCRRGIGLSEDPAVIYMGGGNSGYGALNLAFLRGATRIVLLGYDLNQSGQHWHSGYSWMGLGGDDVYGRWAEWFNEAVVRLREHGVQVVNASIHSRITAFPKVPLAAALEVRWVS
jgi:hypothetical protein